MEMAQTHPNNGWLRRPDVLQLGLPHENECTRYLNVPMAAPAFVDDFPRKNLNL